MVEKFNGEIKAVFEMTYLGLLKCFLGLEVKQTEGNIFISQKRYDEGTLKLFKMDQCKPVTTPMNTTERLEEEDGSGNIDSKSYRSLIGRLLYLTHTRPDITYTVNVLSRFVSKPTMKHFGVKNICCVTLLE